MAKRDKLTYEEFERLVEKALISLPEEFQDYLENVAIVIEDEPPDDMPGLMGLYEGVPLVDRSVEDVILPDCITLFKGPIERACQGRAQMEAEVRMTVLHEIGHFFGLTEEDLEEFESGENPEDSRPDKDGRHYHGYY